MKVLSDGVGGGLDADWWGSAACFGNEERAPRAISEFLHEKIEIF